MAGIVSVRATTAEEPAPHPAVFALVFLTPTKDG
jgi:hypothetical protein